MPKPRITVSEAIDRVGTWMETVVPPAHVRLRVLLGASAKLARVMDIGRADFRKHAGDAYDEAGSSDARIYRI